jgi:transposase
MLKIGDFIMIRELYQKGWTQTAMAKETGFDRKTIRKYLNADELPERKTDGKKKEKKLDPYKDYLLQRIKEGQPIVWFLWKKFRRWGIQEK